METGVVIADGVNKKYAHTVQQDTQNISRESLPSPFQEYGISSDTRTQHPASSDVGHAFAVLTSASVLSATRVQENGIKQKTRQNISTGV